MDKDIELVQDFIESSNPWSHQRSAWYRIKSKLQNYSLNIKKIIDKNCEHVTQNDIVWIKKSEVFEVLDYYQAYKE